MRKHTGKHLMTDTEMLALRQVANIFLEMRLDMTLQVRGVCQQLVGHDTIPT